MVRLGGLPLALLVLGTATEVMADWSYSLTYRAAEGCPTRERFVTELDLRSQGLREAADETHEVTIEVWFEGRDPTNGILLLRDREGQPTVRTIPGATCDEVVAALALTASLLIDAQRQATQASAAPDAPVAPVAPAVPAPPPLTAKPAAPASPVLPPVRTDTVDEGSEGSRTVDKPSRTLEVHVGAGAAAEQGVAPDMALAGAFELAVEWHRRHVVEPLIGVTFERTLAETVEHTQGEAQFHFTALRLGVCPLRLPLERRVVFRPCGLFEGGAIDAEGVDVPGAADATAAWWAAGVSARLELDIVERLSMLVELGGRLHFKQDRFYFDPDSPETTLFEVPPAGFFGRAGIQGGF